MFKQKPLNQTEFVMKIVTDLGQISHNGSKVARYAVFECPKCNKHFTARATGKSARQQASCQLCTRNPDQTTKHPLYAVWNGIRQRCYNPKRKDYKNYGGKGVSMSDHWINDAKAFIDFCVANGWVEGLVVDKDIKSRELGINPSMYAPETLSFITPQQNSEEALAKCVLQYGLDGTFIAKHASCVQAALSLGKPASTKSSIANCCRGLNKTSLGFVWKYELSPLTL